MFSLDELTVGTAADVRPMTAISGAGYQARNSAFIANPIA
jgi:hypothetical protein